MGVEHSVAGHALQEEREPVPGASGCALTLLLHHTGGRDGQDRQSSIRPCTQGNRAPAHAARKSRGLPRLRRRTSSLTHHGSVAVQCCADWAACHNHA
jgi:hypothetical protein